MTKVLKVIFTGVCTFAPGVPETSNETISDFFALMPAARFPRLALQKDEHGKPRIVARHQSYLYVPDQILKTVPEPAMLLRDEKLGLCNIYLMDHARIAFDRIPNNPIKYILDAANRPVQGVPDDDDAGIAPRNDSRWVADSADIFLGGAKLRSDVDPRHDITNGKVTMVVHLKGGRIEANHPCVTAQPRTFQPAQVEIPSRALAPELVVTMEFPDDTESINLTVSDLDPNESVSGLVNSLELFWLDDDLIQLRIGNDTLDEIVALRNKARCAPSTNLPIAEAEFDLHYDLLEVEPSPDLPLPTREGNQGDVGGCVGVKVKLPGGGS